MRSSQISDSGFCLLSKSLKGVSSFLQTLNINLYVCNQITDSSLYHLGKGLKRLGSLRNFKIVFSTLILQMKDYVCFIRALRSSHA